MRMPLDSLAQSDLLTQFCSEIISRHSDHWPPEENKLAEEFVDFFHFRPFANFETLQLKFKEMGIEVSLSEQLPEQVYGFNGSYAGQRTILVSGKKDYLTREHTLLHEMREMLEHIFCELGHPISEDMFPEERAEEFAFSVRLYQSGEFWKDALDRTKAISSKWKRRTVYGLLGIGGLAFVFALVVPLMERSAPAQKGRFQT